jgi:hypothetical protein
MACRLSKRGGLVLCAALCWGGGPALAAEPPPCTLLFGHGRNFDPAQPAQNELWDRLNQGFNQAVREVLHAAGQRSAVLVLPVSATDLARNLQTLLGEAHQQGCTQVLETTVFANPETQTLIARLRLYPLLGSKGPRAPQALPQIGAVGFTSQRDFDLGARGLERLRAPTLAREMGLEALRQLEQPAAP